MKIKGFMLVGFVTLLLSAFTVYGGQGEDITASPSALETMAAGENDIKYQVEGGLSILTPQRAQ